MLFRGITRAYRPRQALSWWASDPAHAARYCQGKDRAQLLSHDEAGLRLTACPEEIGDSWLADEESQLFAMGFLRGIGAAGFRRRDEAGEVVCLLPEALRRRVRVYEQF